MNKKITRRKVIKINEELLQTNEQLRQTYLQSIYSMMEIRQAVGDDEAKLSQADLVNKIKSLYESNNEKV
jgi:hypothetical protein